MKTATRVVGIGFVTVVGLIAILGLWLMAASPGNGGAFVPVVVISTLAIALTLMVSATLRRRRRTGPAQG